MNNYKGYRIKIGNTIIPNILIAKGTYSFKKSQRTIRSWVDGNGISHEDNYEKQQVLINFAIRARNLDEQQEICALFQENNNVICEYWDDYICDYATGKFKMETETLAHESACGNEIRYKSTKVKLGEY